MKKKITNQKMKRKWKNFRICLHLGLAYRVGLVQMIDALGRRANAFGRLAEALGQRFGVLRRRVDSYIDALGRRANAFGRLAEALGQRFGVLRRRVDSYVRGLKFFSEMLKEHFKKMAPQKKNAKPRAVAPACHKH
nr:hypothetical protein [Tanacetum cinerariifolium]